MGLLAPQATRLTDDAELRSTRSVHLSSRGLPASLLALAACGGGAAQEPVAASRHAADPAPQGVITESMGAMPPGSSRPPASRYVAPDPSAARARTPIDDRPSESPTEIHGSGVERKIAELRAPLRHCYARALGDDPGLSLGALTIRFTHAASGKITKVEFPCTAPPSELAKCMRKVFLDRDDLFAGKEAGETTTGPACPATPDAAR